MYWVSILGGESGVQGWQPLPEREVSSQPSLSPNPLEGWRLYVLFV
jgi:hypothetical protein